MTSKLEKAKDRLARLLACAREEEPPKWFTDHEAKKQKKKSDSQRPLAAKLPFFVVRPTIPKIILTPPTPTTSVHEDSGFDAKSLLWLAEEFGGDEEGNWYVEWAPQGPVKKPFDGPAANVDEEFGSPLERVSIRK